MLLKNQNEYKQAVKKMLTEEEDVDFSTVTFKEAFDDYFRRGQCRTGLEIYPTFYPCEIFFDSDYRGNASYYYGIEFRRPMGDVK